MPERRNARCFRRRFAAGWLVGAGLAVAVPGAAAAPASPRPNLVIILADDLGVGDVRGLNPDAKINTPNLDALIASGAAFTDAHSGSSVCTPTRYGLMTGRSAWRTRLKRGVIDGYSGPLIPPGRDTLPSLLQRNGYRTAMVGKWHLGLGWSLRDGDAASELNADGVEDRVDFAAPIVGGPCDLGFDSWFGIAASLDFPPYAFIENDRLLELPSERRPRQGGKRQGEPQLMMRAGPQVPGFEPDQVMRRLTDRAVAVVAEQSADTPFFLYLALTAPHTPVTPHADFVGTSDCGRYGDFVQEIDHTVGRVVAALESAGLADNTLVVFTADNGSSRAAFPPELEAQYGHATSGIYKGRKASLDEGGHRVPFIVRWPQTVRPGSMIATTCSLEDFYATAADLVDEATAENAGEDSFSLLPLLRGEPEAYRRPLTVHHDFAGRFAVREGRWKLLVDKPGEKFRLYDLDADPGETRDRADVEPAVTDRLRERLTEVVRLGRTTPGPAQANDGPAWWPQLSWMSKPVAVRKSND